MGGYSRRRALPGINVRTPPHQVDTMVIALYIPECIHYAAAPPLPHAGGSRGRSAGSARTTLLLPIPCQMNAVPDRARIIGTYWHPFMLLPDHGTMARQGKEQLMQLAAQCHSGAWR